MATQKEKEDTVRVMSLLMQVWDKAHEMAAGDGIPERDRAAVAGACLGAFLDAMHTGHNDPGTVVAMAYLDATTKAGA